MHLLIFRYFNVYLQHRTALFSPVSYLGRSIRHTFYTLTTYQGHELSCTKDLINFTQNVQNICKCPSDLKNKSQMVYLSLVINISTFHIIVSDARGLLARGELHQSPRDEDRHAGRGRGQLQHWGAGDGPAGEQHRQHHHHVDWRPGGGPRRDSDWQQRSQVTGVQRQTRDKHCSGKLGKYQMNIEIKLILFVDSPTATSWYKRGRLHVWSAEHDRVSQTVS